MSDLTFDLAKLGHLVEVSTAELPNALAACVTQVTDVRVVDLCGCDDVAGALAVLAQRLGFPEYFGGNLDALFDVVNESAFAEDLEHLALQAWLIKCNAEQKSVLQPIRETLSDALGDGSACLTILWWVI